MHRDGWCSLEKANALAACVLTMRPALCIEVGTWAGRSAIPMALALKKLNAGKLICIDPWKASDSVVGMSDADLKWWASVDHEAIFKQFTGWIASTGVGPFVEVQRCRSDEFDHAKLPLIDLCHLDGNHGLAASVFDVTYYATNVRVGGFLYFDDLDWASKASSMLPSLGYKQLYIIDGGALYQRLNYEV